MKRILYVFCFFLLTEAFSAQAQPAVRAELLAQKETVFAGKEFFLALKLTLPRGWHVYWKNPGDAGEPVSLKLDLPEGFEETGRFWPAPDRFSVGTLTEYGYKREAWMIVRIRAADQLKKGDVFEISGKAVWLGCRDECVPMSGNVATLVVAEKAEDDSENEEVSRVIADLPEKTGDAVFYETSDSLILSLIAPVQAEEAYFFPDDLKKITYSAPQRMKKAGNRIFLFMKKAAVSDFIPSDSIDGTLVFYNARREKIASLAVSALKTKDSLPVFKPPFVWSEFFTALFFAFVGGVLLNLMPCVFPVLSLKAFRLLNSNGRVDSTGRRKAGISYTAGIVLSFAIIGTGLIALRAAGTELGWGFQLQYPPFVFVLSLFLFFLGLVFSDVIVIGEKISASGMNFGRNWGDFGTGVLAVVVATPCAAPFMGTALGYGLISSAPVTLGVFIVMGLGLAFPFLLLDFYPALGRFLPKAGAWTMVFKNFLAFPLYGASAWLLWVLAAQAGGDALAVGLAGLTAVAFCCWLIKASAYSCAVKKMTGVAISATVLLIGYGIYALTPSYAEEKKQAEIEWKPYDADEINEYRKAGVPVFIRFSAKWCLTCLVNDRTAFSSADLAEAFRKNGVVAFLADWTNRSDEITAALESFGRGGIPLYVYYAPHVGEPLILPQLITDKTVLSVLRGL